MEEVRIVRQLIAAASADLDAKAARWAKVPVGAMIEVPAAAITVDALAPEVDFFSVGTNDLTQYVLAADRGNGGVAGLYHWSHPSLLRMLKMAVDGARSAGKWIGLCGQMGDDPAAWPLLIGLGFDEISLSPPRIAAAKAVVAARSSRGASDLVTQVVACPTRADVEARLRADCAAGGARVMSPDLVVRLEGSTKEETIRSLADAMFVAGRIDSPAELEEFIWQREDVYSTGFGHGFAVPHCKSDAVKANSIVVAQLTRPVPWGSLDGNPVDVVILLAIRAADHDKEHLRIFSRLSRLLMRDEVRDRIRAEQDPARMVSYLEEQLGLRE